MSSTVRPVFIQSVLVVGGCGFLGHHIVSRLAETSAAKVSVLDLQTTRNRFANVSYYDGDITSVIDVSSVLQNVKPQVIIHTASPTDDWRHSSLLFKVNVEGTRNLLECAGGAACVKAFIYTSSAGVVYDAASELVDIDERMPVLHGSTQSEVYRLTKGIADDLVLAANRKYDDMLTAVIRPAAIFGEGDAQIIPKMLKALETGKSRFQLGNNKNLFDFTYVANVSHAHILAAQVLVNTHTQSRLPPDDQKVDGEAFFITNDEPVYFLDFVHAVWAAAGDKTQPKEIWVIPKVVALMIATTLEWAFWILWWGQRIPSLTRKSVRFSCTTVTHCTDKAKVRLGYRPVIDVKDGIKRSVEWHQRNLMAEKVSGK